MTSAAARAKAVLKELEAKGKRANVEGMASFGIAAKKVIGIPVPEMRAVAKRLGRDHELALALRKTGVYEGRFIAALIADPAALTPSDMDKWALEFENWADCDAACANVFDKTPHAYKKAAMWSRWGEEYVKRAGFSLMAALAVHDKKAPDSAFIAFLPLIEKSADDERNGVKKGVNWALRQIGKRDKALHARAIASAKRIAKQGTPSARWIASDALRELNNPKTVARLKDRP